MKIPALPFTVTDWSQMSATTHPGVTGEARWRTLNIGDLRVLEGELDSELRDGRTFKHKPGMSYQVSDFGDAAHRSSTKTGVKLFIVD